MIRHMRHGSPPRLMALQSILSPNRRESLPTPSAGVRIIHRESPHGGILHLPGSGSTLTAKWGALESGRHPDAYPAEARRKPSQTTTWKPVSWPYFTGDNNLMGTRDPDDFSFLTAEERLYV